MKVLLLGGTKFFGKEIVRLFREAGHEISILTRGNAALPDVSGVPHIKGDRQKLEDLERAAKHARWDVVIDNLCYTGKDAELAMNAFKSAGRYIGCSTVSVYRYSRIKYRHPLLETCVDHGMQPREEDLSNKHWIYARGKLDAEKTIMGQKDLPWTLLRPTVVYGPYDSTDRGFWYLSRLMDGKPVLLPDSGSGSFRIVYSQDVARLFLKAAENPVSVGGIYNVAQEEIITLRDFLEESAQALGVKPKYVSVPLEHLNEDLAGPYGNMVNYVPSIDRAKRELGFVPTPFPDYVRSTAKWFVDRWKGDLKKLLTGRDQEIKLAQSWAKLIPSAS